MITKEPYICDDGRWPESSSGCCYDHNGPRCPRLCETQIRWRLDRSQHIPWWTRWDHTGQGVYQCTCLGCPSTTDEVVTTLTDLQDNIWDNGQVMLVDIARREGLVYGPNRRMQELMVERNDRVMYIIKPLNSTNGAAIESELKSVNERYARLIAEAAHEYPDEYIDDEDDDSNLGHQKEGQSGPVFLVLIVACTTVILVGMGLATYCVVQRRKLQSAVTGFEPSEEIVIGRAIPSAGAPGNPGKDAVAGAAVTVAAPTRPKNEAYELS